MAAWLFLPLLALFLQGCLAQLPNYAHPSVQVQCEPHRMVVTVHRDLFGLGKLVEPRELALGPAACPPSSLEAAAGVVVFQVGLHECGSVVQMTPDFLAYRTQLFYKPSLASHPVIARSHGATIGLECRYPRKDNVSSKGLQPTWNPFESTASREAKLGFSLRLMNDDWTAERASDRFLLGEPLHLQADVQVEDHPPLRLWVESCRAGLSPGPTSGPQYDLIGASGCLLDGQEEGVSSAFLTPRLRQETLRFTVDAFRFAGEAQKLIYITCRLKVTPADQPPDVLNKACSFDAASHSWVPVEGPSAICHCCEARRCSGAVEELDPEDSEDGEIPGQRSLREETAGPEVTLALGPLFVLDPQRGNAGQFPGEPAEEEMAREELIPAVPKMTHPPFREQRGSSNVPGDRKDHEGLFLEAFVQKGPIFFTGAEEGSGFGDSTEAVTASMRRKQPTASLSQPATAPASAMTPARRAKAHFSATGRSALSIEAKGPPGPLGDMVASTAAKLPKEAPNMAAKDGKQGLSWPLLLLPTGAAVVALLSLVVWLLVRRRHRASLAQALPVSLELQCK